jgi:hypothetical protein
MRAAAKGVKSARESRAFRLRTAGGESCLAFATPPSSAPAGAPKRESMRFSLSFAVVLTDFFFGLPRAANLAFGIFAGGARNEAKRRGSARTREKRAADGRRHAA